MARRMDRRVQRTRKLLRESMMALILEEGYDEISIQDITDKANLGRATFYLHFKDRDELLLEVMEHFLTEFIDQLPQLTTAQWQFEDTKAITRIFDFAAEHYDLFRILMIGSGGITATRQLHSTLAENLAESILVETDEKGAQPLVPIDFIANHFAGSLLATIYWWLDNDLPYTVEEMAEMFQKVNQLDQEKLLGYDTPAADNPREMEKRSKKRSKDKNDTKEDQPKPVNADEISAEDQRPGTDQLEE